MLQREYDIEYIEERLSGLTGTSLEYLIAGLTDEQVLTNKPLMQLILEKFNFNQGELRLGQSENAIFEAVEEFFGERKVIAIVGAPEITLEKSDKAEDALLKFYWALGWNGVDILDPRKVRTTKAVYYELAELIRERCSDDVGAAMLIVNKGPSVDDEIPEGTVYLYEGWIAPDENEDC